MRLVEHLGKKLLARGGIGIPEGGVATSPEEARQITADLARAVVVKAQILAPSRGKRGGIAVVESPEAAAEAAAGMIGVEFGPEVCSSVLVETKLDIVQELYASVMVEPAQRQLNVILTRHGHSDHDCRYPILGSLDRNGQRVSLPSVIIVIVTSDCVIEHRHLSIDVDLDSYRSYVAARDMTEAHACRNGQRSLVTNVKVGLIDFNINAADFHIAGTQCFEAE